MTELDCAHRVREHLVSHGIPYTLTEHRQTFTAQAMAQAEGVPGRQVAKPVILSADGELVMAVLAAPDHVSMTLAKQAFDCDEVELATEAEFGEVFGDCELGAEPPFGNLYGMPVVVDGGLMAAEELVFNAGDHRHSMRISMEDYLAATQPREVQISA
jgi:Ala-tRNA(Pro) deacylase